MIVLYVLLTCLIATSYAALIIFILNQWQSDYLSDRKPLEYLKFSVIIPARNEAQNIKQCLDSILKSAQIYKGELELIIIDDNSEDSTFEVASQYDSKIIRVFRLSESNKEKINAYKKAAINFALEKANHHHIVQFDADVTIRPNYFETLNQFLSGSNAEFVAAPVCFSPSDGILESFQTLDMMGMMAVTQAGIQTQKWHMANGANMIYKKTMDQFEETELASGDDIFKVQKQAAVDPDKIHFFVHPDVIVNTAPEADLKSFWRQRLRWATKNKLMKSKAMQLMMVIPFLNAWMLIAHGLLIYKFGIIALVLLCFHLFLKLMVDYVFLNRLNSFFKQNKAMRYFLISNILNVIYIALIGLASLFVTKYTWKGRRVN